MNKNTSPLLQYRILYFVLTWMAFTAGYVLQHDHSFTHALSSIVSYDGEKVYDWKLAQYLVSYQSAGFIRRGLVASILYIIPQPYWLAATIAWNIVVLGLLAFFISDFLSFSYNNLNHRTHCVLACILLIGPGTAMNAGFDFGRYDWININLIITSLFLLGTKYKWLLVPVSCAGLFIHGAFLFYGIPCILLAMLATPERRHIRILFFSTLAAYAIAIIILALFGQYDGTLDSLRQSMQPYDVREGALKVWLRSGSDNVRLVISQWANGLYNWFDIYSYILFIAATSFLLIKAVRSTATWRCALIFFAPVFVFPLYILGIDYARWVMLYICITMIALAYGLIHNPSLSLFDSKGSYAAALILCLGMLGPLGSVHAFPAIRYLATTLIG